MGEWVFFMHPPREDFMATMSDAQRAAFDEHATWLRQLLADGVLIAADPCLGRINTGIAIFEAASQPEAERIVAGEPVTKAGHMTAELRPYRLGLLLGRGRDGLLPPARRKMCAWVPGQARHWTPCARCRSRPWAC